MTGFLPLGATLRLYRASFGVLRRHRWILLVFLTGYGATLLVTEPQRMLAIRKFLQTVAQPAVTAEKMPTPWYKITRWTAFHSLPSVAAWCRSNPCGFNALWLAAILLFVYRRQVLPQLVPADSLTPAAARGLKYLLWGSAGAPWALLILSYAAIVSARAWWRQPLAGTITFWLSLPVTIFWMIVIAYLACGLITAARHANAGAPALPTHLLEVNPPVFQQLLKLAVLIHCLMLLPAWLLQNVHRIFSANHSSRILAQAGIYFTGVYPALCLAIFPAFLFIVLEQAHWRTALRQTVALWRRHDGEWLALLLPVLILTFAVNFSQQWLTFYAGPFSNSRLVVSISAGAIGTIVSAWWLVTVVRWWDVTKTRADR